MTEEQQLTKRERRLLRKQQEREAREGAQRTGALKKILLVAVLIGAVGFGVFRLVGQGGGEVLGETIADLGRDHTQDISGIEYNSNPPTSGTHFPVWAKKGVYDRVISDGYLLHSLEHGYIVVSYDCTRLQNPKSQILNPKPRIVEQNSLRGRQIPNSKFQILNSVYAHEEGDTIPEGEPHPSSQSSSGQAQEATESGEALMRMNVEGKMSFFTPENPPATEVELPESFSSSQCQELEEQLKAFYEKNKSRRVIVVPRPNMDVPIALTAWNRILKLETWDEVKAQEFVNQWENKGPEKTVE